MTLRSLVFSASLLALFVLPSQAAAIVGGEVATRDYPHMAALFYDSDDDADNNDHRFRCGASLIRPDWILTAAHCVRDDRNDDGDEEDVPASKLRFVVGVRKLSERAAKGETLQAAEVIVHENYQRPNTYSHDIALVRLESSTTRGAPIHIADPLTQKPFWAPGKRATVIGWGGIVYPGIGGVTTSDDLRQVTVPMVSDAECELVYPADAAQGDFEDLTMVCAGERQGTKDSCSGDSGGPLMVPDATGAFILAGTVSWGFACGVPAQYGVYGRVGDTTLHSWIQSKLPSGPPAPPAASPLPAPPDLPPDFPGSRSQGSTRVPPRDITALVTRRVLKGRRLVIGCRLRGGAARLRSCQVTVSARRGRRLERLRTVTLAAGKRAIVRTGRARRLVLSGVLLAQDGNRYRVRRTLRRSS